VTTKPPSRDHNEEGVQVRPPETWSTGIPSVLAAFKRTHGEMGPLTTARALLRLNKKEGFDCPGCAWPDPDHRKIAEFCENGAKHVAAEATARRLRADFFARHSVTELGKRSDWWLEEQGRLIQPLVKHEGSDHYRPASWNDALDLVARELQGLSSPDQAVFYTSGRASNEAAFAYQLFVRAFGTNNLPDCSNMCHESSGVALTESIGVGKGSCTVEDLVRAELIVICGQNPGTNHPRMLTYLAAAKQNGATIVAVNPLPEAGLLRFKDPQSPRSSLGSGVTIADEYVPLRLAGDQALFLGLAKCVVAARDQGFIESYTAGYGDYVAHVQDASWADIEAASGVPRPTIEHLGRLFSESKATVVCWAMGLTQHRNSVASIQEIANVLLLQGNIGKEGAGVFPVRGHSNVQGDRTMGIAEKMPEAFLDALGREFAFESPRAPGWDSVNAVRAMADGRARVLFSLGGNLVRAISDSALAERAMGGLRLTVSVATKLNRSHTITGDIAVILPTLGRSEIDPAGAVTVEDSIGQVHASRGFKRPAGRQLRSEAAIICGLARRVLGPQVPVPWEELAGDYRAMRERIARVVPGFADFEARVSEPGGFLLAHPPRDNRTFPTPDGKAHFVVNPLEVLRLRNGELLMQTIRSHDQFNTTVYSHDDRYRGIHGSRRVVLVNPDDAARRGLADGDRVDVVSVWDDGVDRRLEDVRVVAYPVAPDCCATYFPEGNVLVPLDSVAAGSNTPTSKSVVVRLVKRNAAGADGLLPGQPVVRGGE
jgi:molybdopterin-dependent oxidoreductase alpha subunit